MDLKKTLKTTALYVGAQYQKAREYWVPQVLSAMQQHRDLSNYGIVQAVLAVITLCLNSMDAIAWVGMIQLLISAVYMVKTSKRFLNAGMFFLAFSYLLHLGQYLLKATGIAVTPTADITALMAEEYLISSGRLVILAHICLAIGNCGYYQWRTRHPVKKTPRSLLDRADDTTVKYVAYLLIGIGMCASLYVNITLIRLMIQGGYINTYTHSISGMVMLLEYFWAVGVIILLGVWRDEKKKCRILLAAAVVYLCATMFTGSRMMAFANILVLCCSYIYIVEKPRPGMTVLIGVLGIAFVAFVVNIGLSRSAGPGLSFDIGGTLSSLFGKVLAEFGGTGYTLALVMQQVPTGVSFLYGITYPLMLLYIFPNFGWNNWPVIDTTCFSDLLREFTTSGIGGSYIGEAYFNFGYFGLILIVALGIFVAWFDDEMHACIKNRRWLKLAPFVSMMPYLLMITRGFIKDIVRPFIWCALAVAALWYILTWVRKRKRSKT